MSNPLTIKINGTDYEVGSDVTATSRLANFLSANQLLGTTTTCYEGGCGACVVVATVPDPDTGSNRTFTVNSCLVPTLACVGWEITTIEGLGNMYDGYHPIEIALVKYSGTQCGWCTPGMVMNMHGLTQSKPNWTPEDVEKQLDGSLCRCTGYRPILEALKSITPQDIEEAGVKKCPSTGKACKGCCSGKAKKEGAVSEKKASPPRLLSTKAGNWHQPVTLQELYDILSGLADGTTYTLVSGNTGQAVYSDGPYSEYIYTRNIGELSNVTMAEDRVTFGADVSITRVIEELNTVATSLSGFSYASQLVEFWKQLGNTGVRNLGAWAGNIAMKVAHPEFPSDLFTGMLAAGAVVTTATPDGATTDHNMEELLSVDLVGEKRVILSMSLGVLVDDVVFRTFKVMPRAINAKADVNAGFNIRVDTANAYTVQGTPVITFGGINASFVRATATEAALVDKSLQDPTALQGALDALASEVAPDYQPADASPEYRLALTQNLLYKTILGILGDSVSPPISSGATSLQRPLSSGTQTFDTIPENYPVGLPMHKLEAPIQCSGEIDYIHKHPTLPGELYGVFLTSTQANAQITSIDPSPALAIPGVVDFVGVGDITGVNKINSLSWTDNVQPVFPEDRVSYYGQPLGLVLATDRGSAIAGKNAIVVTYSDIQPPVLTIEQALQNPLPPGQFTPIVDGDVAAGFAASTTIVEGSIFRGGQYHFHMENHVTLAIPTDEGGLDVKCSSQWLSETQRAIAQVTGLKHGDVHVSCKRMGGAFGAKIDQCNMVATAVGLAAHKTRRPVRVQLDLHTNMTMIGGREPHVCNYKVGVDDAGLLQAIQATIISDSGYAAIDISASSAAETLRNCCYSCPNWEITPQFVLTNTAITTWCRGPGVVEGIFFIENIMDHVATALGMDPLEFRQKNLIQDGANVGVAKQMMPLRSRLAAMNPQSIPSQVHIPRNLINDMINQILVTAEVETRKAEIATFNQNNLWKKKGLSVMPQLYPYAIPSVYPFASLVSVNAADGSVTISHGGMESGQGLNTKVAQIAAKELGVPLNSITLVANNSHANANSQVTGGSYGSDVAGYNVGEACKMIKARIEALKKEKGLTKATWGESVLQAFLNGVDISQRFVNGPDEINSYAIFGVACTEVELDVLTGQFVVTRADILEDAGNSLSPLVDIGQIEGGFVMGQGLVTTESILYDPTTGEKVTNSTWNYNPPSALDIPADLRVTIMQNAPNPIGIQSSKVTGEPPLCLSYSVAMALRQAVASARQDAGTTGWFQMDLPLTTDYLQRLCLVDASRLTLS